MSLWLEVLPIVKSFRPACSRRRTFFSMALVLVAFLLSPDRRGVAGFVRAGSFKDSCYRKMLQLFNGSGVDLARFRLCWCAIAMKLFTPAKTALGQPLFLLDGTDVPKSGRKMPARHLLYNHSNSKNLPKFFQGHSFQVLGLLAQNQSGTCVRSVPLVSVMDDGAVFSNRETRTKIDRGLDTFLAVTKELRIKATLVADAAYCAGKVLIELTRRGHTFVSRIRNNGVAYEPAAPEARRGRGRPRKFGNKVVLRSFVF